MRLSARNLERLKHIPPGGGFESIPIDLRVDCHKSGAARIGHRYVYGRLAPDRPAATITAHFDSFTRGRFAHPWEDRNISLREGARLQAFPDDYVFVGTQEEVAAQIGNAIPPPLALSLGAAIRENLSTEPNRTGKLGQLVLPLAQKPHDSGSLTLWELSEDSAGIDRASRHCLGAAPSVPPSDCFQIPMGRGTV